MNALKQIDLMLKLSKLEGKKESLVGRQNLSVKLFKRGAIGEDLFIQHQQTFDEDMQMLSYMKRDLLKHYAAG